MDASQNTTQTKDDLSKDILKMMDDALNEADGIVTGENGFEDSFMQKLCIYIVRRDHKIHNHAYKLGYQSGIDQFKDKMHEEIQKHES